MQAAFFYGSSSHSQWLAQAKITIEAIAIQHNRLWRMPQEAAKAK